MHSRHLETRSVGGGQQIFFLSIALELIEVKAAMGALERV